MSTNWVIYRIVPASVMLPLVFSCLNMATSAQESGRRPPLGTWHSIERFGGEPRVTVSFRGEGAEIVGWATMLGMQRKTDDRATLGFSFCGATWRDNRVRFKTILPDEEGTTEWELRLTAEGSATLMPIAENGVPIENGPSWQMGRQVR